MSLILKEINLPKEGNSIIIEVFPCGSCSVMKVEKGECHELEIVSDVQAIQIPKGHGRLIDGDALKTIFKNMAKCEWNQKVSPISWAYAFEDTIDEIEDAPTILEAEE